MLHRDLKPGNLLHFNGRAKLADFGLVTDRIAYGYASAVGYTEHLAPEVHIYGVTSRHTDCWAFGMTMFRLLNGEAWYTAEKHRLRLLHADGRTNLGAVRQLICSGGFATKLRWMPHVRQSWRRFVRRALHDNSGARFASGGEMLSHFQKSVLAEREPWWVVVDRRDTTTWTARPESGREWRVEWTRLPERAQNVQGLVISEGRVAAPKVWFRETNLPRQKAYDRLEAFFAERT
jgi:serine/threonine-protein kinase